jgi:SAM-dependent methyltransferase
MSEYDATILDHYKRVAAQDGLSPSSTMADNRVRSLETELVHQFTRKSIEALRKSANGPFVLFDAGCGNGYTLATLATSGFDLHFYGFEYSPELHALALRQLEGVPSVLGVIRADLRHAEWHQPRFADIIIVQRLLINVLDPHDQKKTLGNIVSALKPGGCILFIEAFKSGLDKLNAARAEFDLDALPPSHHNLPLGDDFFESEERLEAFEFDGWRVPENFLSTHFYAARVLHPVLLAGKKFQRNSHFVTFMSCALAPGVGEFSPIKAFGFRKKRNVKVVGPINEELG